MSKRREIVDYLSDILQAIDDVAEFIVDIEFAQFSADKKTVNAVIRSLEVLGEATKHIPPAFRKRHPEIPWAKMAGMRDVLIHGYMGVDNMTVWKVAKERLPEIRPLLADCCKQQPPAS